MLARVKKMTSVGRFRSRTVSKRRRHDCAIRKRRHVPYRNGTEAGGRNEARGAAFEGFAAVRLPPSTVSR
jgi:hypothetical protein